MCAREIRKGTFNVHKKRRERRPPVRTSRHRKEADLAEIDSSFLLPRSHIFSPIGKWIPTREEKVAKSFIP